MEDNEVEQVQVPERIIGSNQIFDVGADVFSGNEETSIGILTEISRVQDEAGWVMKYYIKVRAPIVEVTRLPLNTIRRSIIPYGSITLQRNEELMLITIDFSPYMRPITMGNQGWIDYIAWHYNICLFDNSATLNESDYNFSL